MVALSKRRDGSDRRDEEVAVELVVEVALGWGCGWWRKRRKRVSEMAK